MKNLSKEELDVNQLRSKLPYNPNKKYQVMGILNLTPDSFYDGSELSENNIIQKFNKVAVSDIVDIGAESSRPGAKPIDEKEEIYRISKFLNLNINHKCLSIDSYKKNVIEFCLKSGFNMINDISGGGKKFENIDIAAKYNVPIILMHMKGTPVNMQKNINYSNIIEDICNYFELRIKYIEKIGFDLNNVILDPGIGFGKSFNHNYEIIKNINKFKKFNCRVLVGLSRKSMLNFNNNKPVDRMYKSISMQAICVNNGANIIRTHDPLETIDSLQPVLELEKY